MGFQKVSWALRSVPESQGNSRVFEMVFGDRRWILDYSEGFGEVLLY